jgi:hypothetical protein
MVISFRVVSFQVRPELRLRSISQFKRRSSLEQLVGSSRSPERPIDIYKLKRYIINLDYIACLHMSIQQSVWIGFSMSIGTFKQFFPSLRVEEPIPDSFKPIDIVDRFSIG